MKRSEEAEGIPERDARRLVKAALAARRHAYAPYSKFRVGAAVLAADGRVFVGVNVENASSPSSLCAEQAAIAAAVAAGARRFLAVAVAGQAPRPVPPCGRCRQVLAEFGPDLEVVMANAAGRTERARLDALLPRPFRR